MIAHNRVFITDPNYEDEVAGGGLFVSYDKVSRQSALVNLDVHIRNTSGKFFSGKVSYELYDRDNRLVLSTEKRLSVASRMKVDSPHLWSPLCFQQRNDCPWAMSMRQKWPLV